LNHYEVMKHFSWHSIRITGVESGAMPWCSMKEWCHCYLSKSKNGVMAIYRNQSNTTDYTTNWESIGMVCTIFDFIPFHDENTCSRDKMWCVQILFTAMRSWYRPSSLSLHPSTSIFLPELGSNAFKLKGDGIVDDYKSKLFYLVSNDTMMLLWKEWPLKQISS
jgi:hypothetical protein